MSNKKYYFACQVPIDESGNQSFHFSQTPTIHIGDAEINCYYYVCSPYTTGTNGTSHNVTMNCIIKILAYVRGGTSGDGYLYCCLHSDGRQEEGIDYEKHLLSVRLWQLNNTETEIFKKEAKRNFIKEQVKEIKRASLEIELF